MIYIPMEVSDAQGGALEAHRGGWKPGQSGKQFQHVQRAQALQGRIFHVIVMSNEMNTPKILYCPTESVDTGHHKSTTWSGDPKR